MATEETGCDAIEGILKDLDTAIETLEKVRKRMKWFHAKTFRQT